MDTILNAALPLVVIATIANHFALRVLIDDRSSDDIMYASVFMKLRISERNMTPYEGGSLHVFNDSDTLPRGVVEFLVSFGERNNRRTIEVFS